MSFLGLIFLKYISDSFYELYNKLKEGEGRVRRGKILTTPMNTVPKIYSTFHHMRAGITFRAAPKLPTIGKDIDDAMDAIEKDNPSLKGVLPKEYAKEKLDKQSLGGLIDLISTIALGDSVSRSNDVLGQSLRIFPRSVCAC
jgi:type I restriction enzyme M protein